MNKPSHPQSSEEVVAAWKEQVASLEEAEDDKQIAYNMVGILFPNDWWDDLEEAGQQDPLMCEVFELVADLETPLVSDTERKELWERVKQIVNELEGRYPSVK